MHIKIRNEKPEDYRKVEEVAREAFWNLYYPGTNLHLVIHNMRSHPDYIPELAFVIEVDGEIVGSIFYTYAKIKTKEGKEHIALSFGPVSILPRMHRKGLGRKLITHSIEAAKGLDYPAILTLGYPYHYEPYGFKGGKKYNIAMPDGKFYKGLLVLPLYEGALEGISGQAFFSDAVEVEPSEEEVNAFDKAFPPKKKQVQESQKEYEISVGMLDE